MLYGAPCCLLVGRRSASNGTIFTGDPVGRSADHQPAQVELGQLYNQISILSYLPRLPPVILLLGGPYLRAQSCSCWPWDVWAAHGPAVSGAGCAFDHFHMFWSAGSTSTVPGRLEETRSFAPRRVHWVGYAVGYILEWFFVRIMTPHATVYRATTIFLLTLHFVCCYAADS